MTAMKEQAKKETVKQQAKKEFKVLMEDVSKLWYQTPHIFFCTLD
jgi:hypothetical protein